MKTTKTNTSKLVSATPRKSVHFHIVGYVEDHILVYPCSNSMKNCTHVNTLLLVSPAFRRQYLNRSLSCTAKVFMASLLDIKGTISVPITPVLDGQTWVDHSGNIHLISKEIIDALKLERQTPAGKEVMQHAS